MNFEKVEGSTWNTVAGVPADKNEVKLSIGGVDMPAVSTKGKNSVTIKGAGVKNAFTTENKYNVIVKGTKENPGSLAKSTAIDTTTAANAVNTINGEKVGIKIAGKIKNDTTRAKGKAADVPQFKVTYLVSAISKAADDANDTTVDDTKLVGYTYVGDDKAQALMQ